MGGGGGGRHGRGPGGGAGLASRFEALGLRWMVGDEQRPAVPGQRDTGRATQVTGSARDPCVTAHGGRQRRLALVDAIRDPSPSKRCVVPVSSRPTLSPSSPSNGGGIFDTSGNVSPWCSTAR